MPRTRSTAALLLLSFLVGAACASDAAAGERWLELRATPRNGSERARLVALGVETKEVDPSAEPEAFPGTFTVFLTAADLPALDTLGVPYRVLHADLEAYYRARLAALPAAPPGPLPAGSMGGYETFDEAVGTMDALVATYPGLITAKRAIGSSREGRPLWMWKLSRNADLDENEPATVFLSLMHAREPAGLMGLLHTAKTLLAGYGVDPECTWLLDHRELYLVPVLNPDGYVYNQATNPGGGGMWRKNRRDNGDRTVGVDLNRNFSFKWAYDNTGSSPQSSSDTYRGPAAFSEPESQALRDFVVARKPAIVINTHTFGDDLIRPWDYADLLCGDDAIFEDLSRLAVRGTAYSTGNVMQTLGYLANGGHDDYMYGEVVAKPVIFGFTPEAGNSNDGFWPAAARILPIAAELATQNRTFAWTSGATPRLTAVVVDDRVGGNGDGAPAPGETVRLVLRLRNHGLQSTAGPLRATLTSPDCNVVVEQGSADFGTVSAQSDFDNQVSPFVVRVGSTAAVGKIAQLSLVLADDTGDYPEIGIPLLLGAPTVAFADGFEAGGGAWILRGWGIEAAGGGRGGNALSDSVAADYDRDADGTAQIRSSFDLSAVGHAWLLFDHRLWIDNDFDAGLVEVSSDAGGTWTAIRGEGSDSGSGTGRQAAGGPVYDGRIAGWVTERVDLGAFVGPGFRDVRLRFHLASNGSIGADGWHIDDVRVLAFPPASAVRPPADPAPLLAARVGADAVFRWPAVTADPGHGPADVYTLHRSNSVRAERGFVAWTAVAGTTAVDPGAAASARSYAYQVVAGNCGGVSSEPPR